MSLAIHLLGAPSVHHDGVACASPRGHKPWALLALLLLSTSPMSRERLAGLLFGDADDPLGSLRWNLAELRRLLGSRARLGGDPVQLELPPETLDRRADRGLGDLGRGPRDSRARSRAAGGHPAGCGRRLRGMAAGRAPPIRRSCVSDAPRGRGCTVGGRGRGLGGGARDEAGGARRIRRGGPCAPDSRPRREREPGRRSTLPVGHSRTLPSRTGDRADGDARSGRRSDYGHAHLPAGDGDARDGGLLDRCRRGGNCRRCDRGGTRHAASRRGGRPGLGRRDAGGTRARGPW